MGGEEAAQRAREETRWREEERRVLEVREKEAAVEAQRENEANWEKAVAEAEAGFLDSTTRLAAVEAQMAEEIDDEIVFSDEEDD